MVTYPQLVPDDSCHTQRPVLDVAAEKCFAGITPIYKMKVQLGKSRQCPAHSTQPAGSPKWQSTTLLCSAFDLTGNCCKISCK